MLNFLLHRQDGSILPLTAIIFPLLLGMAGFGIDVSTWMMNKRSLQNAADAAAIAAAWDIASGAADMAAFSGWKEAEKNGLDTALDGSLDLGIETIGNSTFVTASVSQRAPVWFSAMFVSGDVYTSAAAATAIISRAGNFCLLSLEEEADGAITIAGNVTVDAKPCGIAVNSTSDTGLVLNGNVTVMIGDIHLAGDYDMSGNVFFDYKTLRTGAGQLQDPYEDLEAPEPATCDYNNHSISGSGNRTLYPGTYCNGITINGNNNVFMEPGVYIIDRGDFNIGGNGTLRGYNVTIILTSSTGSNWGTMDVTGGKDIYLTAPAQGQPWEGIAIYQDRNAPPGEMKMTGNGAIELDGVIYAPSQKTRFGGDKELLAPESACTHIISRTITLHGNPHIKNDCEDTGVKGVGGISVRLVM